MRVGRGKALRIEEFDKELAWTGNSGEVVCGEKEIEAERSDFFKSEGRSVRNFRYGPRGDIFSQSRSHHGGASVGFRQMTTENRHKVKIEQLVRSVLSSC
jgi:hypothetical protein